MTLLTPLWMGAPAEYAANADRQLIGLLFRTAGVHDPTGGQLAVTERGAGADWSVDVAAGVAIVAGSDIGAQGFYVCGADAPVNLAVDPAPPAGTSRIDLIVARVRDGSITGVVDRDWVIERIGGSPTATPTPPPLPPSSLELARVTVGAAATAVTNAMISDSRVYATTHDGRRRLGKKGLSGASGSGSYRDVSGGGLTVRHVPAGRTLNLRVRCFFYTPGSGNLTVQVLRGTTLILNYPVRYGDPGMFDFINVDVTAEDTPPAGTSTYKVQAEGDGKGIDGGGGKQAFFVIEDGGPA